MMAKSPRKASGSIGSLKHKPKESEGLIPRTLAFIQEQLPAWRDYPHRPKSTSENALNPSLCAFLERKARLHQPMFLFFHQEPQSARRSADISVRGTQDETVIGTRVFNAEDPYLVIEGKVVPQSETDREKEYVAGWRKENGSPTGGIQRFKLGLHGAKLETCVIIGYLLKKSASEWHALFNQWINEFAGKIEYDSAKWTAADVLQELHYSSGQRLAITISQHTRPDSCVSINITLTHFLIEMSSINKASMG
jgi:hypothetical protein